MTRKHAAQNSAPVHIGDTPHSKRNLLTVAGVVMVLVFYGG